MTTITHTTSDHQIQCWTVAELKEAIEARKGAAKGKKEDLRRRAMHLRDTLKINHEREEEQKRRNHEAKMEREAKDISIQSIKADLAQGLERSLDDAKRVYDKALKEMQGCANVAHWVKWNMENTLEAEAWMVQLQPLVAFAQRQLNEPTMTMDELETTLIEQCDREMTRLTEADPNSMGMNSGVVSLSEFKAKQKFCRFLRQTIKTLRKERQEHSGSLQYLGYCI